MVGTFTAGSLASGGEPVVIRGTIATEERFFWGAGGEFDMVKELVGGGLARVDVRQIGRLQKL